jgi:nucleoside-diphosphate-sugar epimerase
VFARVDDVYRPDSVELVTGDITKKSDLRRGFGRPDIVFHLASCNDEDDPTIFSTNVLGTENVAALCREKKVKQLVFLSSAGVVGESRLPVKEHSRYNPKTKFDKSKVGAERVIKDSGITYTIVRVPLILGPNAAWAKIFDAIKNGHPIAGGGHNKFHIVHVEDAVNMLLSVFNNKKAANHIFNIAAKDVMTYCEFYNTVCKAMRTKNQYKYRHLKIANVLSRFHWYKTAIRGHPTEPHMSKTFLNMTTRNCVLSIQKAKDLLGFEPNYTTPTAIHMTVKDIKAPQVMPY